MTTNTKISFDELFTEILKRFRRERGITQAELGLSVFKITGQKLSRAGAQKMISLWENGHLAPNPVQLHALAQELGCEIGILTSLLANRKSNAIDLFNQLEHRSQPSLVIECCNSVPRMLWDSGFRKAVVTSLAKGVCLTLVVPYPWTIDDGNNSHADTLQSYYRLVRLRVEEGARSLQRQLGSVGSGRVAVFVPRDRAGITLVPPFGIRQVLVIKTRDDIPVDEKELYLWVKTRDLDELWPAAKEAHYWGSELSMWDNYFRGITGAWHRSCVLSTENGMTEGQWQRTV